jgi:thioredoxin-like negative regulator of GroEL
MDRLLILLGLAMTLALLAVGARWLARDRVRRVRALPSQDLWNSLATAPDGRPAVVAFSTPSCAACHTAQKPALAALQSRAEGAIRVLEIDAASRPEVASRFGILTVPATAVLDPTGQLRAVNHGFAGADRLADQLGLRQS